jgi:hypothetical protein
MEAEGALAHSSQTLESSLVHQENLKFLDLALNALIKNQ